MCGSCAMYSGMNGNDGSINKTVGFFPSAKSYSSMSSEEQAEYDALLKEANTLGYETVAEYVEYLETLEDQESKDKLSKLNQWINDGSIEKTAATTLSLINTLSGLWGGNDTTNTGGSNYTPTSDDDSVPTIVWVTIGFILLLIMVFLYVKFTK